MWLATKFGFYSIVRKRAATPTAPAEFHVRARVRQDLENLLASAGLPGREILDWDTSDYRYRFLASAEDVALLLGQLAATLDYSNFKSEIARTADQRARLPAYHRVWEEMMKLQR